MDTRDTPEQAELRRAARRLAGELGPANVADLDDARRCARLAAATQAAGWLELRHDRGDGMPLATGVETAIVAEALGAAVADVPFTGRVLAADMSRRAGAPYDEGAVVAFDAQLTGAAAVDGGVTTAPLVVADAAGSSCAYVLVVGASHMRLGRVAIGDACGGGTDLTRPVQVVAPGARVEPVPGDGLDDDDLVSWIALGLALTCADLVGTMRGALDLAVAYATERRQYGVPVGSFQAVQHLLAEARCLFEGSRSIADHASWAADQLDPHGAVMAGRVAKAYCASAARTVHETAVQVHGGIGNTWECLVHVYLRRALLSTQWFGDEGVQLDAVQRERLGVRSGLP